MTEYLIAIAILIAGVFGFIFGWWTSKFYISRSERYRKTSSEIFFKRLANAIFMAIFCATIAIMIIGGK